MKLDGKMEHTHYNLINRELTLMDDAFSECRCSFVFWLEQLHCKVSKN